MVVIGIDFGNDSCRVSVWQNGKLEIVKNNSGLLHTPSIVAFGQCKREFGVSAKKQWSTNVANTIFDFKSIMNVNQTTKWKFNLLKLTENPKDSTVSFDISVSGKKLKFTPYQVLAMLFAKIKADTQAFLQTNERIIGCVLAVPSYFSDQERKSVLMAAAIAGLDCHFLIKETTAVAINYSLHKKFPFPLKVIFIDFGQSSFQMSACKFSERRLEVIEEMSEMIGGRDIDERIADYLLENCKIRGANKRSKIFCVDFLDKVEQLKKKMSYSVESLPLEFKQLFNCDQIFMERAQMENICAPLFAKVEKLMRLFLERSQLKIDEIHSIEMVGGSSHIPIVKKLVEKVFGKAPILTMDRDEAVARGCLLKSIMNVKRKGYKIVEKPFDDGDNCSNFSGQKELVRMFQVHRFLKCDCRDSFNVTEDEFIGFVEMEKQLTKYDRDEDKRQIARNNLRLYLMEHTKPEGLLINCNAETKKELQDTMALRDGTKDQYVDLLYYWTQKIEKLKKRKRMQQDADERVNDLYGSKDEPYDGTKKLTFKESDEVNLIERNECSSGNKSGLALLLRIRRKGLHSRHLRLNNNGNAMHHNRHIDGNQKLLFDQKSGQRKMKRTTWCCFL